MATARMTRADASRAQGEREMMRYAARNVRICQMRTLGTSNARIAEESGLSPSRTSRIISKGEDHWQRWLDRAIEEGIEQEGVSGAVPDPDGERIEMLNISRIADNPWQPRTVVREEDVTDLMHDILENKMHHPIVVRIVAGSFELVLGQLRLLSFRRAHELFMDGEVWGPIWDEYHDRATGITKIPAIVREMTDDEVKVASLSENLNRNAMVWSDTVRALDVACLIPGVTARQVAAAAKMSPGKLSDQRRLLRLPPKVHRLIDDGILSWTAARELLAFAPSDHIHQDELDYCETRLWAKHREYVNQGNESRRLTAEQVLTVMANALDLDHEQWGPVESITPTGGLWIRGNNFKPNPKFNIERFEREYGDYTHTLTYLWGTTPVKSKITCKGDVWRVWQADAEEEEQRDQERLAAQEAVETERANQLGPRAETFSNENALAERLPRKILRMLDDGKLTTEFVRRLLGFVSLSHSHEEYLLEIAERLQRVGIGNVQLSDSQAGGVVAGVLRMKIAYTEFRSLDDRLTSFGFEAPRFDMTEFLESQRPVVHCVPIGIGVVRMTCSHEAWRSYQDAATEAVKQQVARVGKLQEVAIEPAAEPAAHLQDIEMADIPQDELAAQPAKEVSNCAYNLKRKESHWHVEWNATRGIWLKQSPAFLNYSEAVAYRKNAPDDVEVVIVRHIYH